MKPEKRYILTRSKRRFYFHDIDPTSIDLYDIAFALSRICRFTGHTSRFYSVAEHSLRVAYHSRPEIRLEALFHDAAEAYIGDVSAPLKSYLPDYRAIEKEVERAIQAKFGLDPEKLEEVKEVDLDFLQIEARDLIGVTDFSDWGNGQRPKNYWIEDVEEPQGYWRQRFIELAASLLRDRREFTL